MTRTKGGIFSAYINRHRRVERKRTYSMHTYTRALTPSTNEKKKKYFLTKRSNRKRTHTRSQWFIRLNRRYPGSISKLYVHPYELIMIFLTRIPFHSFAFTYPLSVSFGYYFVSQTGPRAMLAEGYRWENVFFIRSLVVNVSFSFGRQRFLVLTVWVSFFVHTFARVCMCMCTIYCSRSTTTSGSNCYTIWLLIK